MAWNDYGEAGDVDEYGFTWWERDIQDKYERIEREAYQNQKQYERLQEENANEYHELQKRRIENIINKNIFKK